MSTTRQTIADRLSEKGLRVTTQRIAILEAVLHLDNHPSAEHIIDYIKKNYPSISVGTVYKVLESLVESGLMRKVKTEGGTMRFDPLLKKHHHLYCESSNRIEDYEDAQLDELIADYFRKKGIADFEVGEIQLHITGRFK